ncbi:MAG: hypothetical protein FWH55_10440 [Oscillospiraceae bacterium]|nr:hypothetical protein [Oscillospiraceae bacterium]
MSAGTNRPFPDIAAGVISVSQGEGANGATRTSSGKLLSIQDVQVNFSSEFHTAGSFIKEFEESVQRVRVKSVSLTRLREGVLKGVLNLEYIALTDNAEAGVSNRRAPDIDGRESIFQSYSGYVEEDADTTVILQPGDIDVEPNFYMVLNQSVVNDAKIRFGVYPRSETELFYNVNSAVKASLTISGDENEMSYTYTLGTSSRTERRRLDVVDGSILISVISGPRANEDDKVAVLLDVENNTDLPLEIMVRNEDVLNPRFNLGDTSGQVTVLK